MLTNFRGGFYKMSLTMLLLLLICVHITLGSVTHTGEKDLQGKIVAITGAAQGIGFAIAYKFLEAGAGHIIVLDKQVRTGTEAAAKLNIIFGANKAIFIYCDVTKDLKRISNRLFREYEYIDVLVNDAGVLDEDCPKKTIDTNALALIQWSLKFWEHMRKDKQGKGGTIINLSSMFGHIDHPFIPVYTASKFAVLGFSKSLGHDYTYNYTCVRVITLCPGFTYTAMTRKQMVTDEQAHDFIKFRNAFPWQTASDVAKGAVKVFQNAKTGTAWDLMGGESPTLAPDNIIISLSFINSLP